jgi:hypothetical protein
VAVVLVLAELLNVTAGLVAGGGLFGAFAGAAEYAAGRSSASSPTSVE